MFQKQIKKTTRQKRIISKQESIPGFSGLKDLFFITSTLYIPFLGPEYSKIGAFERDIVNLEHLISISLILNT